MGSAALRPPATWHAPNFGLNSCRRQPARRPARGCHLGRACCLDNRAWLGRELAVDADEALGLGLHDLGRHCPDAPISHDAPGVDEVDQDSLPPEPREGDLAAVQGGEGEIGCPAPDVGRRRKVEPKRS